MGLDENRLFLSILTLAEYDKCIANLADDDSGKLRHMATRNVLEERFTGRILPPGNKAVLRWGEISGRVRRDTGHPPPVIGTLLAATAIGAELYLVSRNARDAKHSVAAVFDPWNDDPAAFPLRPGKRRVRDRPSDTTRLTCVNLFQTTIAKLV